MGEYTFNPPASNVSIINNAAANPSDKSGGDKPRIFNVFSSTIVLDELSMQGQPQEKDAKPEDNISLLYPMIKINDYYISDKELVSFNINSEGKIPAIRVTAQFANDLFLVKNMPKDGDIMSIMIRSKSDVLKPIRNDYIITEVMMTEKRLSPPSNATVTIYGELFIPGINNYLSGYNKKGTSMEAMKGAAKILGLGFNTNEDDTDDHQLWLMKDNFFQFFDDTCERSWKDSNSFFDWWVDIYYNLNYVNVQKQLLAKEDDIDLATIINSSNTEYLWDDKNEEDKPIMPKVFCNSMAFANTAFYIRSWKATNSSSAISKDYGLSLHSNFFEHNDLLYNDPESQKLWNIRIEPAYDPDKIDKFIVLRGRPYWDKDKNPGQLALANYDYNEMFKKYTWSGIQYTISNPDAPINKWTGNHHRNYMIAKVHNILNIMELSKLYIDLSVVGVNLNIILGDKIPVAIIKNDIEERVRINPDLPNYVVDHFYSGWYYVRGFSIGWSADAAEGSSSRFFQTFILTRREWPTPIPVAGVKKNNKENTV